jgi:DNA modification methylase
MNPETSKHYHDAPFPKELAKRCILLYSFEGETVLDPFAGTFTTCTVAKELNRNSIGIELSEKYAEYGKENIGANQQELVPTNKYVIR